MITDYGASEYDANSALAELDKALRSNNIGEKAEIIVKVPIYFEKYPFPVFVNSIFLKLTEVFRSGTTNFLRKCVLQVAERSETHLDKIISREEIAKRILTVSYSNDPIARSLTLRFLGCLSNVFEDRQQIHHLIRTSLDSHDADELHAAIFAAERFAQHSQEFSTGIYDKVAEMLLNDEVPIDTKIAVVPVFQHMHTDPLTTEKVFCLCRTKLLLPNNRNPALICAILRTLTGLSLSSLTTFSSQIELLLEGLNNSKSFIVKRTALSCLEDVSKTAPNFWTKEMFQLLCDYLINVEHTERNNCLRLDVLKVLSSLTRNKIIVGWKDLSAVGFHLLSSCSTWISLSFDKILSSTCEVLANIISNGDIDENMERLAHQFCLVVTEVISIWDWKRNDNDENLYVKKLLRSVVVLCKRHKNFAEPICRTICGILHLFSADKESTVFETLFALYDCEPAVIDVLRTSSEKFHTYRWHLFLMSLDEVDTFSLDVVDESTDGWMLYKLGRFASRFGKHAAASQIFQRVEKMVVSDFFHHWVKFLTALSNAECKLARKENLGDVISLYIKSTFYLKAAVLPTNTLWFQIEYITRKIEYLKLIDEIRTIWNVCRLTPPPTVAVLSNNRTEKASHFINQFSLCVKSAMSLADKYEKLLSKCFDADSHSLDALRLEQLKCSLLVQCLGLVLDHNIQNISLPEDERLNSCCKMTAANLRLIQSHLQNLKSEPEKLSSTVIERVLELIEFLTRQPTYLPRYFFQSVQTTALKLVISPQPNTGDISINLPADQRLALKVEGVVSYSGSKTKKYRRVNEVVLYLTTDFGEVVTDQKGSPMEQRLEKSVKPHNDYFSAEVVLQIPQSGIIFVRADVMDDVDGRVWDISVEEQLRVKVLGLMKPTAASSLSSALPRTTATPMNRT